MRERIRAARASQGGFTLIELLIVVVILGVLAGIAVFGAAAFNNEGKLAACKTDVKNVETASEAYYAKNNGYAAAVSDLVTAGYLKEAHKDGDGGYKIIYNAGTVTTDMAGCPA